MQRFKAQITLDASGNGSKTVKLGVPFLLGNLRGFITAERLEFFRIYFTVGEATVVEEVGGVASTGGAGGAGATMRSTPKMVTGVYVKANELVTIKVNAGTINAASVATVMFDWEQVKLNG